MIIIDTLIDLLLAVGLAIQYIENDEIMRVKHLILKSDIDGLEKYLYGKQGQGMLINEWPISDGDDHEMMVCFTHRVKSALVLPDMTLKHLPIAEKKQVIGLPVIKSSVFSLYNRKVCFTFPTKSSGMETTKIAISSLSDFSLTHKDGQASIEIGYMHTSYASAEDGGNLVIVNGGNDEGWTSLQMKTIENSSDVVSFVLDMIPEGDRQHFIEQVDSMGWTLLHWAAFKNHDKNLTAMMSQLSTTDQRRLASKPTDDNRGWTILHCAAIRNSCETLSALINKFPNDINWKSLVCQDKDGRTALHLAVAEQNVNAVIVLLDEAADQCKDFIDIGDAYNSTVKDYTSEYSLLGQLLRVSSRLNSSSLHELAKIDDDKLVGFRLSNLRNTSLLEEICKRNNDGLTVMHVAAEEKSSKVLALFARMLSSEELLSCLTTQTDRCDGDTVLHLVARSNNPSSLHLLLNAVERQDRLSCIEICNDYGERAHEAGSEHSSVVDTLNCEYVNSTLSSMNLLFLT